MYDTMSGRDQPMASEVALDPSQQFGQRIFMRDPCGVFIGQRYAGTIFRRKVQPQTMSRFSASVG